MSTPVAQQKPTIRLPQEAPRATSTSVTPPTGSPKGIATDAGGIQSMEKFKPTTPSSPVEEPTSFMASVESAWASVKSSIHSAAVKIQEKLEEAFASTVSVCKSMYASVKSGLQSILGQWGSSKPKISKEMKGLGIHTAEDAEQAKKAELGPRQRKTPEKLTL